MELEVIVLSGGFLVLYMLLLLGVGVAGILVEVDKRSPVSVILVYFDQGDTEWTTLVLEIFSVVLCHLVHLLVLEILV